MESLHEPLGIAGAVVAEIGLDGRLHRGPFRSGGRSLDQRGGQEQGGQGHGGLPDQAFGFRLLASSWARTKSSISPSSTFWVWLVS
ncbi:MAG: hypothetical protein BWY56_02078 [Acidobacteria bacterium ADurb.Bin340]|nr:MAG: hypothetical protein BWY56_02078 [Acidobacteria bacterium ADurb.Bin340]